MPSPQVTLTPNHAHSVRAAVEKWVSSDLISNSVASKLLETIHEQPYSFDWGRFAKYSFRLAVICIAAAVGSLFLDDVFRKLIRWVLAIPPAVRAAITALVAAGVHYWALQRAASPGSREQVYLNEAIHGLGAILLALADAQVGEAIEASFRARLEKGADGSADLKPSKEQLRAFQDAKDSWIQGLILLLAVAYGGVALLSASNFMCSLAFVALAAFLGAWTGYSSATYVLGINQPVRFVVVGSIIIALSSVTREFGLMQPLWSTTRIWGLLYVFVSLWILSIWGAHPPDDFPLPLGSASWSVAFLAAAVFSVWHGLSYGDGTTKGFGLTFIGINLYTKFFEYCWEAMHKAVFFGALGLSLGVIGKYAETIWNLSLADGKLQTI